MSRAYLVGTVMLWLAYFMGLVIFYARIYWMPILFREAGLEPRFATPDLGAVPARGCRRCAVRLLMDRYNANRTIAVGYGLAALSVYSIGQSAGSVGPPVVVFTAGAIMNTAQSSTPALAATSFPTQGRATGVSWMLGLGRFGGIVGSLLGAELSLPHMAFDSVRLEAIHAAHWHHCAFGRPM